MRFLLASASLGLVAFAAGCGSGGGGKASAPASITGVPWVLESGLSVDGWEASRPTAIFAGGTVGGSTGCNHYTAAYKLDGDSMDIGPVASTQMACPPPRDAVEAAYLAALGKVAKWRMDSDKLVLQDGNGQEILRYDTAKIDGDYEATAVRTVDAFASLVPGTAITAKFADGTITGSAGCNSYHATYTTERGRIHIDLPGSTRKLCASPVGVMEQEADYLAALAAADRYRLDGSSALALLAPDGTYLVSYAAPGSG